MARRSQRLRLLDMASQMAAIEATVATHGSAAMQAAVSAMLANTPED